MKNKHCPVSTDYYWGSQSIKNDHSTRFTGSRYIFRLELIDESWPLYKVGFEDLVTGQVLTLQSCNMPFKKKVNNTLKQLEKKLNSMLPENIEYYARFSRPRGIIKINLQNNPNRRA